MENSQDIEMLEITDKSMDSKINFFVMHKTIKEMVIFSCENYSFTLEQIYKYVKDKKEPFKINVEEFFDLELNVDYIDDFSFNFKINGIVGIDILRKPIIYKTQNEYYEFVATQQIDAFLQFFSMPMIECKKTKEKIEPTLLNINDHLPHDDQIIESFKYIYYEDENKFNNFFKSHKNGYVKKEFKSPLDFDKNFNYYFNIKGNLNTNEKFYIYEGESCHRSCLRIEILSISKIAKQLIYYGISGRGKSITLLGSLKYRSQFSTIGTLYINCKTLKYLIKDKKISNLKQLLIDEIIYLTGMNFLKYNEIIKYIKYYVFKNQYDFWTLIENIIIKFCNDNLQYVFGFDQYNNTNDYYSHLNKLKVFCNNKNNMKFVIFSSMNENDIRKIKIQKLFYDDLNSSNEKYIELNNICDTKEISKTLNFEQFDIWEKLGKTMKSLMEIKSSLDLTKYLKDKKIKLTYKLISFFASEKEIESYYNKNKDEIAKIPLSIVNKILSFSTENKYKRDEILTIIENIPFRYFNIIKNNKDEYKIDFGFPLIKEIMSYLYKFIMLKYNYNILKNNVKNKGSGLATIFEMKVIFRLLPNKNNNDIFYNFIINEHVQIESIIKRLNETKKNKIKNLRNNTNYIIEQDNFGGKDLDCLIINIIDSIPYAYGFQISIYKDTIFTMSYLKTSFTNMIENIFQIFNIKIKEENTYFGYIFDYSRISDDKYTSMLNDCINNNCKFCFFETEKEILCDKKGRVINDINEITSCPFTNNQRNKINISNSEQNLLIQSFFKNIPSESVLKNIILIISQDLNININYLENKGEQRGPIFLKNMINIKMLDSNSTVLIIYLKDNKCVAKIIKDNKILESKNMIELCNYHVYEIK